MSPTQPSKASGTAAAPGERGRAATLARPELRAVRDDERIPFGPAEYRRTLGAFATGVTVIAAPSADRAVGFACQSFTSLSLDPPLVAFMVSRTSSTWPRIAAAGAFCASILGAGQAELCRSFAVSGADKFAGVAYDAAPATGSPRLTRAVAWVDCRIHTVHTGGDHLIVVGSVEALGATAGEADPLVFHRGRFRTLRR